jgi:hypothetical protein
MRLFGTIQQTKIFLESVLTDNISGDGKKLTSHFKLSA